VRGLCLPSPATRQIANPTVQVILDGVTAAVVGLIDITSAQLLWASLPTNPTERALAGVLFLLSLAVLYRWKSKLVTVVVVLGATLLGFVALLALGAM
jgi:chromate transporter